MSAKCDLEYGGRERDAVDGSKRPETQLHAEHEEKQGHAELGHDRDGLARLDETETGRPEDDARADVADERGLAKAQHDQAADRGRQENQGYLDYFLMRMHIVESGSSLRNGRCRG